MAAKPKPAMRKFDVILAATKETGGIGSNGTLPWSLPKDMKHFKETTTKTKDENKRNAVIMGRTTWESIPEKYRPMKGRINVVLTRTMSTEKFHETYPVKSEEKPLVFSNFDDAINALSWEPYKELVENVFVIGGVQVYETAIKYPLLNRVILTEVEKEFECDRHFNLKQFGLEEVERSEPVEDKDSTWQIVTYQRTKTAIPWSPDGSIKNLEEIQYLDMVRECIEKGVKRGDRTGVGTLSVFGRTMRYSLRDNVFPLLTTKSVFWRGVAQELFWFIKGSTNANELANKKIHIWDGNGTKEFLEGRGLGHREAGDLGPVYGFQWRHFGAEYVDMHTDYSGKGVDQLMNVIKMINTNAESRRIIMTAWNPKAQPEMALPPCHMMAQFYVANGELSCMMYQRSCDMGLGVPFNIASYALLTRLVAQVCDLKPGDFVHVLGDTHVYLNHVDPLKTQLEREPYPFPKLYLNPNIKDIEQFTYEDIKIVGYKKHPKIKMEMAV